MIGEGPHVSTFRLACLMPELWPTLCTTVWPRAARTDTSSTLDRKRSGFEAKTLRVARKGIDKFRVSVGMLINF